MRIVRMASAVMLSVLVLLGSSFTLPSAALAAATTDCTDGPGAYNSWRGQAVGGGAKHGTSGTVPARTFALCTNPGPVSIDGSFYYSNVEPASGTFRDIIQIGYGDGRSPTLSGGIYYVWAYGRSESTAGCSGYTSKDPLTRQVGAWSSGQHDYKVWHRNNKWDLIVDSTVKKSVDEASICWSPGRSTWFGETWDRGDRVGGTAASPMQVNLMNYATTEGGGFFWTNLNPGPQCNVSNEPPVAYQCAITGSRSIEIWTDPR